MRDYLESKRHVKEDILIAVELLNDVEDEEEVGED
jgi:hypothetical protein